MLKKIKNENKAVLILSAVGFIVFFALAMLFPYSGDDWAWGSELGLERLRVFFADYNGRYAGNLLVLLLTRSKILRSIFVSSSVLFGCYTSYISLSKRRFLDMALSLLLFLVMPYLIFSQSIVWTSGYTNYVPSILMTVFCFVLMRNIFEEEKPSYPWYYIPLFCIIAFVSSLFMETVTILNIAAIGLIILYSLIKFKKLFPAHFAFLAGSVIGAAVMFSNGAYTNIANSEDEYRDTALTNSFLETLDSLFEHGNLISDELILKNLLMFTLLSVICVALGIMFAKRSNNKKLTAVTYVNSAVSILGLIIFYVKSHYNFWLILTRFSNPSYKAFLVFYAIIGLYMLSLVCQIIICIDNKATRDKLLFYLICIAILIAPLFVVNPVGPRCYFAPYFVFIMLTVTLINYIINELKISETSANHISAATVAGIAGALIFLFTIFIPINHYANMRDEYVKAQVETDYKSKIYVCTLPYSSFVWAGNPADDELLRERYLMFNGIETDKEFEPFFYEQFEKFAVKFNKKTGYRPNIKPRKIRNRFYYEKPEEEEVTQKNETVS